MDGKVGLELALADGGSVVGRRREQGREDEDSLQTYFIGRIQKILNNYEKKIIGWDEIIEGGLVNDATVMSWRGEEGGIFAAKAGNNAIMSPTSHLYFDYYQARTGEPLAIGGLISLEKVYSYEPIPEGLDINQATKILGAPNIFVA